MVVVVVVVMAVVDAANVNEQLYQVQCALLKPLPHDDMVIVVPVAVAVVVVMDAAKMNEQLYQG